MPSITYPEYLHIDTLLGLVRPLTKANDEPLFIVAHQAAELWLKLLLEELGKVRDQLANGEVSAAALRFRRGILVVKTLSTHFDTLDTITPETFSAFREALGTASGSESVQFRAFDAMIGHARALHEGLPPVEQAEWNLNDALHAWIRKECPTHDPVEGIAELAKRPEVAVLIEVMTDFEEAIQHWRFRHAQNAARLIGTAPGTAGTSGAEHLRSSIHHAIFPTLRKLRDRFAPRYK